MVRLPRVHLVPLVILLLVLLAGLSLQTPRAAALPVQQPETPHTIVGRDDCLLCHKAGGVKPVPAATHASYDNKMCLTCHKVAAAVAPPAQATAQPAAQSTQAPVAPASATATNAPAVPGVPALVPHPLEGRAACSTCHGIAGLKPYPKDHIGRPDTGCLQCHVPVGSTRIPTPGVPSALPAGADSCLACHRQTDLTMTLSAGQKLSLFVDGEQFAVSVHAKKGLTCVACHPKNNVYPHPAVQAASARELNRGIMQQACATCHKGIYDQYKESVHGKALLQENNLDVPACTDCHGKHNITDPRPESSPLFRLNSPDLCSSCHADAQLMGKYAISTNVTKSYLNDFHGASVRLQKDKDPNINSYKAVCYDCHGIHDIKMTNDPTSSVVKANLVKTCQKCHPNADANFPTAWTSHYTPDVQKWPLVYFVNLFYSIVIPVTIGGMVAFIALDIARTTVNKRKSRRAK